MSVQPPTKVDKANLSKWIAFLLDDLVKLPGTKRRIGLDPVLGLIPGLGDLTTSTVGLILIASGLKKGVPKSVYLRMTANWALNALVGAIPILGDLFSFWYKSNRRNHALLRAYLDETAGKAAVHQGWVPVIILALVAIIVLASIGAVAWWGAQLIWQSG